VGESVFRPIQQESQEITMMIRQVVRALPVMALLAVLAAPSGAAAQSQLPTAEAQQFLGSWNLALQTDMGPFEFGLTLRDAGGRVAAQVRSELGNVDVNTLRRSGDNLVLEYAMDAQGQSIPVSMTLRPDGDAMRATMDFAGGLFTANGNATRTN